MLLGEVMGGPELNTWLTRLWSSLGPWGTVNKDRLSVALVIPKLSMCLTWAVAWARVFQCPYLQIAYLLAAVDPCQTEDNCSQAFA